MPASRARAFGTDHHERILSAEECADDLPGIVSRMDVPMADASVAPTWLLSGVTREHVTVALGGDGADELWAGYEHYIGFKVAEWYNALPAFVRRVIIEPLAGICRLGRVYQSAPGRGYVSARGARPGLAAGA